MNMNNLYIHGIKPVFITNLNIVPHNHFQAHVFLGSNLFCLSIAFFVSHQNTCSGFQPAWGIHSVPTLLQLFIIYSQRWVLLLLFGVGFKEYRISKAPCLHPLSPQSWRQGPAVLMIRRIYGAISVSHLLPENWGIKGKISGWHWDRDYPVCAIWLQTSTGCFLLLVQLNPLCFSLCFL